MPGWASPRTKVNPTGAPNEGLALDSVPALQGHLVVS
jgi:hypothetical protein